MAFLITLCLELTTVNSELRHNNPAHSMGRLRGFGLTTLVLSEVESLEKKRKSTLASAPAKLLWWANRCDSVESASRSSAWNAWALKHHWIFIYKALFMVIFHTIGLWRIMWQALQELSMKHQKTHTSCLQICRLSLATQPNAHPRVLITWPLNTLWRQLLHYVFNLLNVTCLFFHVCKRTLFNQLAPVLLYYC